MDLVTPPQPTRSPWMWMTLLLVVFSGLAWGIYHYIMPTFTAKPAEINKVTIGANTPTARQKPRPSATPAPTPTVSPSPTPIPVISNLSITTSHCSQGSSCYGWTTVVKVIGSGLTNDFKVKLIKGTQEYPGSLVGGDGRTLIIIEFYNLPHCTTFDVAVSSSLGSFTKPNAVSSTCP